jgi:hypothetical protein
MSDQFFDKNLTTGDTESHRGKPQSKPVAASAASVTGLALRR